MPRMALLDLVVLSMQEFESVQSENFKFCKLRYPVGFVSRVGVDVE